MARGEKGGGGDHSGGRGRGRPGGDAVSVKVSALDPRQRRSRQHLRDELSPAFSFYGQK